MTADCCSEPPLKDNVDDPIKQTFNLQSLAAPEQLTELWVVSDIFAHVVFIQYGLLGS